MKQTLRILCEGLIDYAGLFPPAKLAMGPATENYAKYLRTDESWMLARFICPATRLAEFTEAASVLMPGTHATSGYREHAQALPPWRLSVIIDGPLDDSIDLIGVFNEYHAQEDHGLAIIDAIELRAPSAGYIDETIEMIPEDLLAFFEIDPSQDVRGPIAALAGENACAKIRCGGVRAEMIPPANQIARFIDACAHAGVRFKATAGLHHPVRAERALTYDAEPERAVMHGFINVFMASALRLCDASFDIESIESVLAERDAGAFRFEDDCAGWRSNDIGAAEVARMRESFAMGFGSCSFDEPLEDLRILGLLGG